MKHLLATTLLSLFCCAANAEWKSFAKADDFEIFIEDTSVKVRGEIVRLWVRWTYKANKTLSIYTYRSASYYQSFQCVEDETRITYAVYTASADGSGESVHNTNTPDTLWRPILPGTYDASLKAWACR